MIGRRGVLGMLAAGPAIAKSQLGSVSGAGNVAGYPTEGQAMIYPASAERNRLIDAIAPARDREMQKFHEAVGNKTLYWINSMKSWSPAFKHHVHQAELRRLDEEWPDLWGLSNAELLALAVKKGLTQ